MILINEYKKHNEADLAISSLNRYVREIEAFGEVNNPNTATYADLAEYFTEVKETVAVAVKSALVSYFNFLMIKGLRTDNPVDSITVKTQSKDVDYSILLSSEELDKIMTERENHKERYQMLKWRNLLLLSFVRYQALTNSDILNLELESVIDDEKLKVRATSTANEYTYELNAKQIKYWFNYQKVRSGLVQGDTEQLFLNKRGFAMTGDGITSVIDTLKPLFPYNKVHNKIIRQSVIVEHAKKFDDVLKTQSFARHKWYSTTEKYFEFVTDELRDEVERLHPFNMM